MCYEIADRLISVRSIEHFLFRLLTMALENIKVSLWQYPTQINWMAKKVSLGIINCGN